MKRMGLPDRSSPVLTSGVPTVRKALFQQIGQLTVVHSSSRQRRVAQDVGKGLREALSEGKGIRVTNLNANYEDNQK